MANSLADIVLKIYDVMDLLWRWMWRLAQVLIVLLALMIIALVIGSPKLVQDILMAWFLGLLGLGAGLNVARLVIKHVLAPETPPHV